MEFFEKADIPCTQMQKGGEYADRMARYLESKGKKYDAIKGICPRCGTRLLRQVLPDGRTSYLPGNGWPELCPEIHPELKRKSKGRFR